MNIQHNEKLCHHLSSAYVLGTLKGGARRRFEAYMQASAIIQQEVIRWQNRLHPLAEFAPSVQPRPQVWQAIEKKLASGKAASSSQPKSRWEFWLNLHNDLSFWRGLGMVSTTLATILIALLATRQPELQAPATSFVAMLADDKAQTAIVITGDASHHQLVAHVVTRQGIAADKSLELWAIPKNGAPRPLGLVTDNGNVTLPLPDNATPQTTPLLAVSLEPKGGSPDPKGPTGPILFKGAWVQI